jgi:hypothetical protein
VQVEGGFWPTASRPGQMCPAVVPRRFENGSHHLSFAPLELLVSVTSRAVDFRDNFPRVRRVAWMARHLGRVRLSARCINS